MLQINHLEDDWYKEADAKSLIKGMGAGFVAGGRRGGDFALLMGILQLLLLTAFQKLLPAIRGIPAAAWSHEYRPADRARGSIST